MINSRQVLLLAGLSLAGCGGEPQDFDEEGELDTDVQAVTSVNHCATGTTANALGALVNGFADGYTRPMNRANPGGPCGSNPRRATYVEYTAPVGHLIHFSSSASFDGTPPGLCALNSLVFKIEKFANGAFQEVHSETVNGETNLVGTNCHAFAGAPLLPVHATGRYRIRTVAPRWDGLVDEVDIWGDDQQP